MIGLDNTSDGTMKWSGWMEGGGVSPVILLLCSCLWSKQLALGQQGPASGATAGDAVRLRSSTARKQNIAKCRPSVAPLSPWSGERGALIFAQSYLDDGSCTLHTRAPSRPDTLLAADARPSGTSPAPERWAASRAPSLKLAWQPCVMPRSLPSYGK